MYAKILDLISGRYETTLQRMGLSSPPWHQTNNLSHGGLSMANTTQKQQNISESNAKVTNSLKFTEVLEVAAPPANRPESICGKGCNPTLLLSLTQGSAAVAQSPSVPRAIWTFNENFRLWPHAGFDFKPAVQPRRTWTEWPLIAPTSKRGHSIPFLVLGLKIVFSLQWSFQLQSKPTVWFQRAAEFIFDSESRYLVSVLHAGTQGVIQLSKPAAGNQFGL